MARRRYQRSGKAKSVRQGQKIDFSVQSLDPLAQGVSRDDEGICFVAKTLPGEKGQARVMKKRSGVRFARLENLDAISERSEDRVDADCPHYADCPGCHYLHTSYENEIDFKRDALCGLFDRAGLAYPQPTVIAAPRRFNYRNRMQLHYRHKHIGMVDAFTDKIVEIPRCRLLEPALQESFQALYEDRSWHQQRAVSGHCEVYHLDGETRVEWDKPYAQGGFTQVYAEMNEALKSLLRQWAMEADYHSVLDLFAGDGNLSEVLVEKQDCQRVMVDYSARNDSEHYFALDLYEDEAWQTLRRQEKSRRFDLLLLDPPRKGLPELAAWLKAYRPEQVFYVSCNAATLVRDLKHSVADYEITQLALLDLFPGTQHFETAVSLARR